MRFSPVLGLVLSLVAVLAHSGGDIRLNGLLTTLPTLKQLSVRLPDCSNVSSIRFNDVDYPVYTASRVKVGTQACEFHGLSSVFANKAEISLDVLFNNGNSEALSESYRYEQNVPEISLQSVGVDISSGTQSLILEMAVLDDTDVSFIDLSVKGFKASDVRNAGGVVNNPAVQAFVDYKGRIYPDDDASNGVVVKLDFLRGLSNAEIQNDGILIIDAVVSDPSGNTSSLSEYRYTGDGIVDRLESLAFSTGVVVISDMLDSFQLAPIGSYKYRGDVPLVGRGSGLQYQVSNPDLIGVTAQGILYPKKEEVSLNELVTITHVDGPVVEVPVQLNFTKKINRIEWFDRKGTPILEGLNKLHDMPDFAVAYDDGSYRKLDERFPLALSLPEGAEYIELSGRKISSSIEVSESAPIALNAESSRLPGQVFNLPISFKDAPPVAVISGANQISVGEVLELTASVSDDVGIRKVVFLKDGQPLIVRDQPPYELSMNIVESMDGQSYLFNVSVEDSASNIVLSQPLKVTVQNAAVASSPGHLHESPSSSMPVVEGNRYWYRAAYDLGLAKHMDANSRSDIESIIIYVDDKKAEIISYPVVEPRMLPTGPNGELQKHMFEVWQAELAAPEISVGHTSISLRAEFKLSSGAIYQDDSHLVRIVENNSPIVAFENPQSSIQVAAGGQVDVLVDIVDDTLYHGTEVRLYVDDSQAALKRITFDEIETEFSEKEEYKLPERFKGSFAFSTYKYRYQYSVPESKVGDEVRFQVKVTDANGQYVKSPAIAVSVIGDQPPGVSVVSPVPGQYITEGETIRVQATAEDDIAVERVEFYVNGNLTETIRTLPYLFTYTAPQNIEKEQVLTFSAVAYDSKGHRGESQTVKTTLGHDDRPPVLEWISPEIDLIEGKTQTASVPESSVQVMKFSAYDNIGISELRISGIAKSENGYELTHDLSQAVLVPVNPVPGSVNQYTSAFLLTIPELPASSALGYESFPVEAVVKDYKGNETHKNVSVRVEKNKGAVVSRLQLLNDKVYPKGELKYSVMATDDVKVTELKVTLKRNGQLLSEQVIDQQNGLIANSSIIKSFETDLEELDIPNEDAQLVLRVTAFDGFGVSDPVLGYKEYNIAVMSDVDPPVFSILSPVQGSDIIPSTSNAFIYRISDSSVISRWSVTVSGKQVAGESDINGKQEINGSFQVDLNSNLCPAGCSTGSEAVLVLTAEDLYGNKISSNWRYGLVSDNKPTLSVRLPALGASYYEGEVVPVSLLPSDDIALKEVGYKVVRDGNLLYKEVLAQSVNGKEVPQGEYVNGSYRVISSKQGGGYP